MGESKGEEDEDDEEDAVATDPGDPSDDYLFAGARSFASSRPGPGRRGGSSSAAPESRGIPSAGPSVGRGDEESSSGGGAPSSQGMPPFPGAISGSGSRSDAAASSVPQSRGLPSAAPRSGSSSSSDSGAPSSQGVPPEDWMIPSVGAAADDDDDVDVDDVPPVRPDDVAMAGYGGAAPGGDADYDDDDDVPMVEEHERHADIEAVVRERMALRDPHVEVAQRRRDAFLAAHAAFLQPRSADNLCSSPGATTERVAKDTFAKEFTVPRVQYEDFKSMRPLFLDRFADGLLLGGGPVSMRQILRGEFDGALARALLQPPGYDPEMERARMSRLLGQLYAFARLEPHRVVAEVYDCERIMERLHESVKAAYAARGGTGPLRANDPGAWAAAMAAAQGRVPRIEALATLEATQKRAGDLIAALGAIAAALRASATGEKAVPGTPAHVWGIRWETQCAALDGCAADLRGELQAIGAAISAGAPGKWAEEARAAERAIHERVQTAAMLWSQLHAYTDTIRARPCELARDVHAAVARLGVALAAQSASPEAGAAAQRVLYDLATGVLEDKSTMIETVRIKDGSRREGVAPRTLRVEPSASETRPKDANQTPITYGLAETVLPPAAYAPSGNLAGGGAVMLGEDSKIVQDMRAAASRANRTIDAIAERAEAQMRTILLERTRTGVQARNETLRAFEEKISGHWLGEAAGGLAPEELFVSPKRSRKAGGAAAADASVAVPREGLDARRARLHDAIRKKLEDVRAVAKLVAEKRALVDGLGERAQSAEANLRAAKALVDERLGVAAAARKPNQARLESMRAFRARVEAALAKLAVVTGDTTKVGASVKKARAAFDQIERACAAALAKGALVHRAIDVVFAHLGAAAEFGLGDANEDGTLIGAPEETVEVIACVRNFADVNHQAADADGDEPPPRIEDDAALQRLVQSNRVYPRFATSLVLPRQLLEAATIAEAGLALPNGTETREKVLAECATIEAAHGAANPPGAADALVESARNIARGLAGAAAAPGGANGENSAAAAFMRAFNANAGGAAGRTPVSVTLALGRTYEAAYQGFMDDLRAAIRPADEKKGEEKEEEEDGAVLARLMAHFDVLRAARVVLAGRLEAHGPLDSALRREVRERYAALVRQRLEDNVPAGPDPAPQAVLAAVNKWQDHLIGVIDKMARLRTDSERRHSQLSASLAQRRQDQGPLVRAMLQTHSELEELLRKTFIGEDATAAAHWKTWTTEALAQRRADVQQWAANARTLCNDAAHALGELDASANQLASARGNWDLAGPSPATVADALEARFGADVANAVRGGDGGGGKGRGGKKGAQLVEQPTVVPDQMVALSASTALEPRTREAAAEADRAAARHRNGARTERTRAHLALLNAGLGLGGVGGGKEQDAKMVDFANRARTREECERDVPVCTARLRRLGFQSELLRLVAITTDTWKADHARFVREAVAINAERVRVGEALGKHVAALLREEGALLASDPSLSQATRRAALIERRVHAQLAQRLIEAVYPGGKLNEYATQAPSVTAQHALATRTLQSWQQWAEAQIKATRARLRENIARIVAANLAMASNTSAAQFMETKEGAAEVERALASGAAGVRNDVDAEARIQEGRTEAQRVHGAFVGLCADFARAFAPVRDAPLEAQVRAIAAVGPETHAPWWTDADARLADETDARAFRDTVQLMALFPGRHPWDQQPGVPPATKRVYDCVRAETVGAIRQLRRTGRIGGLPGPVHLQPPEARAGGIPFAEFLQGLQWSVFTQSRIQSDTDADRALIADAYAHYCVLRANREVVGVWYADGRPSWQWANGTRDDEIKGDPDVVRQLRERNAAIRARLMAAVRRREGGLVSRLAGNVAPDSDETVCLRIDTTAGSSVRVTSAAIREHAAAGADEAKGSDAFQTFIAAVRAAMQRADGKYAKALRAVAKHRDEYQRSSSALRANLEKLRGCAPEIRQLPWDRFQTQFQQATGLVMSAAIGSVEEGATAAWQTLETFTAADRLAKDILGDLRAQVTKRTAAKTRFLDAALATLESKQDAFKRAVGHHSAAHHDAPCGAAASIATANAYTESCARYLNAAINAARRGTLAIDARLTQRKTATDALGATLKDITAGIERVNGREGKLHAAALKGVADTQSAAQTVNDAVEAAQEVILDLRSGVFNALDALRGALRADTATPANIFDALFESPLAGTRRFDTVERVVVEQIATATNGAPVLKGLAAAIAAGRRRRDTPAVEASPRGKRRSAAAAAADGADAPAGAGGDGTQSARKRRPVEADGTSAALVVARPVEGDAELVQENTERVAWNASVYENEINEAHAEFASEARRVTGPGFKAMGSVELYVAASGRVLWDETHCGSLKPPDPGLAPQLSEPYSDFNTARALRDRRADLCQAARVAMTRCAKTAKDGTDAAVVERKLARARADLWKYMANGADTGEPPCDPNELAILLNQWQTYATRTISAARSLRQKVETARTGAVEARRRFATRNFDYLRPGAVEAVWRILSSLPEVPDHATPGPEAEAAILAAERHKDASAARLDRLRELLRQTDKLAQQFEDARVVGAGAAAAAAAAPQAPAGAPVVAVVPSAAARDGVPEFYNDWNEAPDDSGAVDDLVRRIYATRPKTKAPAPASAKPTTGATGGAALGEDDSKADGGAPPAGDTAAAAAADETALRDPMADTPTAAAAAPAGRKTALQIGLRFVGREAREATLRVAEHNDRERARLNEIRTMQAQAANLESLMDAAPKGRKGGGGAAGDGGGGASDGRRRGRAADPLRPSGGDAPAYQAILGAVLRRVGERDSVILVQILTPAQHYEAAAARVCAALHASLMKV